MNAPQDNRLAVGIMAAGSSSRLGRNKQLVHYKGRPLLQNTLDQVTLFESNASAEFSNLAINKYCVLGFDVSTLDKEINFDGFHKLHNPDWQSGLGSSIVLLVQSLPEATDAVMIVLADQWKLDDAHFKALTEAWLQDINKIVISKNETLSPPVIFPKHYFETLKTLQGDSGGKQIVAKNKQNLVTIECYETGYDLDTPEHLSQLQQAGSV